MANNALMSLKKTGNKALKSVKKHSPELLLIGGAIAGVATVVTACRSTLKVNDILDDHADRMDAIRDKFEEGSKELKKETTKAYVKTAWEFGKCYALPAALGVTAVACNIGSYKIQKTRNIKLEKENASLAAAYVGLAEAVRKYRDRVKEKVGEEVENDLWNNLSEIEVTRDIVDEKGKHKTEKKKGKIVGVEGASPYARYLTKNNPDYHKDPAVMNMYVTAQCAHMNDDLSIRKSRIFTLAEAYRVFNFEEAPSDCAVCWKYNPKATKNIEVTCTPVLLPVIDDLGNWNGEYDDAYLIDFNCKDNLYALIDDLED